MLRAVETAAEDKAAEGKETDDTPEAYARAVTGLLLEGMIECASSTRAQWDLIQRTLEFQSVAVRQVKIKVTQAYLALVMMAVAQAKLMRDPTLALYISNRVTEDLGPMTDRFAVRAYSLTDAECDLIIEFTEACDLQLKALKRHFYPGTS